MKLSRLLPLLVCLASAPSPAAAQPGDELDAAIERNRTGKLVIRAASGAPVSVEQLRHDFWFGATIPTSLVTGRMSEADRAKFNEIFLSHFNAAVTETGFKWHDMEREKGQVNYAVADAMLAWADKAGIPLRGHCVYWGIPNRVQDWAKALSNEDLRTALMQRGRSIGARYRGRFAEYDLNNEMIHANYYEQKLGPEITKAMFQWVKDGDADAKLWVNDYDITTGRRLDDYVRHIRQLLAAGAPVAGIGVQGHLHGDSFDPAALRNSLDTLAQFKLPIRVTEFNFPGQRSKFYTGDRKAQLTPEEEQAKAEAIRQYYRICFAHPAVAGILMWGFWEGANWIPQSSLYKRDWSATPAAAAYRELVYGRWWTKWSGVAGKNGRAEVSAFFGKHKLRVGGKEMEVELRRGEAVKQVDAR
jgi:GH35 family endo-1,4-beta-xylanase